MNAETRARCLRTAYRRLVIALLPLLIVGWLVSRGQIFAAGLLFCTVLTLMMTGTLVPRCALFGPMIKRLPHGSGHALLTIDDGPHPEHTPAILDILDRHQMKAIFFLIGERAARHPELVREIVARGHEIANHTQTHPAARFWALRPVALWREIAGCQKTLTAICPDHPPRFFRPPAGHHNVFSFVVSQALGLKMLMWNARGFDGVIQDVNFITERIRRRLKPGCIVLIHEATPVAVEVAEQVAAMLHHARLASPALPDFSGGAAFD
ncbi:MAG: polysaccharide deacetylase family protein [Prosthecobacter sp.]|nr:polysaccharide deacetylase family protein [Prosthecobacter sp.]